MSKIIKCMFFVLLAAVLPLSVHAQQVTLHLQDVTVRKAFRELEVKGNVSLVYEKNDVDLTRKVTVKVDNQPISKALDQILKGQELIYKIKDNHIIITRPVVQKSDKKRRINGVISDVNDELLIGVSVSIPGTSHRNHRKIKEHIFFIINHLYISYFLYFCHILPIFRYSVHF